MKDTDATTTTTFPTLDTIAEKVRAAHIEAESHITRAQEHAAHAHMKRLEVGELLQQAKSTPGMRGRWGDWVNTNCPFDERQAQKYMRLVKLTRSAADPNLDSVLAQLSLEQSLRHLGRLLGTASKKAPRSKSTTGSTKRKRGAHRKLPVAKRRPTYDPFTDETARLLFVSKAQNAKTGSIIMAYVGPTEDHIRASCEGCPLYISRCYAWRSTQRRGLARVLDKAARDLRSYSLSQALKRHGNGAKVARFAAIGDPSRVDHVELRFAIETLKARGFTIVGYTRFWADRNNQWLREHFMASCVNEAEIAEALRLGWRPTLVLPAEHQGARASAQGVRGFVCPAETNPGGVTCATCKRCDPTHPIWSRGNVQFVGFVEHGPHIKKGLPA